MEASKSYYIDTLVKALNFFREKNYKSDKPHLRGLDGICLHIFTEKMWAIHVAGFFQTYFLHSVVPVT